MLAAYFTMPVISIYIIDRFNRKTIKTFVVVSIFHSIIPFSEAFWIIINNKLWLCTVYAPIISNSTWNIWINTISMHHRHCNIYCFFVEITFLMLIFCYRFASSCFHQRCSKKPVFGFKWILISLNDLWCILLNSVRRTTRTRSFFLLCFSFKLKDEHGPTQLKCHSCCEQTLWTLNMSHVPPIYETINDFGFRNEVFMFIPWWWHFTTSGIHIL